MPDMEPPRGGLVRPDPARRQRNRASGHMDASPSRRGRQRPLAAKRRGSEASRRVLSALHVGSRGAPFSTSASAGSCVVSRPCAALAWQLSCCRSASRWRAYGPDRGSRRSMRARGVEQVIEVLRWDTGVLRCRHRAIGWPDLLGAVEACLRAWAHDAQANPRGRRRVPTLVRGCFRHRRGRCPEVHVASRSFARVGSAIDGW